MYAISNPSYPARRNLFSTSELAASENERRRGGVVCFHQQETRDRMQIWRGSYQGRRSRGGGRGITARGTTNALIVIFGCAPGILSRATGSRGSDVTFAAKRGDDGFPWDLCFGVGVLIYNYHQNLIFNITVCYPLTTFVHSRHRHPFSSLSFLFRFSPFT